MMNNDTYRIVELRADNFMRLRAIGIRPGDAPLVQITGRNDQGKSAVLHAILSALGGGKNDPEVPIRKGAKGAEVFVDLGGLKVRVAYGRGRSLTVTAADGSKPPGTPQALLDAIAPHLHDPDQFSRMRPADQVDMLLRAYGLSDQFSEIKANRAAVCDERTVVGREVKRLEGALAALPHDDGPTDEVAVSDLIAERDKRHAVIVANEQARQRAWQSERDWRDAESVCKRTQTEIDALLKRLEHERAEAAKVKQRHEDDVAKVDALVDPDLSAITAKIQSAESDNAKARQRRQYRETASALDKVRDQYGSFARKLDDFDEKKVRLLRDCKGAIPGLTVADDGSHLLLNGVPLSQASTRNRMLVGVRVGVKLSPRFRVQRIEHGSLFDSAGIAELEKIAADEKVQFWVERATDGEPIGIVIEDGQVKEDDDGQE